VHHAEQYIPIIRLQAAGRKRTDSNIVAHGGGEPLLWTKRYSVYKNQQLASSIIERKRPDARDEGHLLQKGGCSGCPSLQADPG